MEQTIDIINNWNLRKMLAELETGNMLIPRFQREYSWEPAKVVSLLNSVYCQYPIGSIFLWIAPKEFKNFIRETEKLNIPENPDHSHCVFILDGQQRVISLFVTLRGKIFNKIDYSRICFNLDKKTFVYPRKNDLKNHIPAWKIFDTGAYQEIYGDLVLADREHKTKMAQAWAHCHEVFMNYPLSIVKTFHRNLDDVVEVFERINQGGKRLTAYDLIQASTWSEKFDLNEKIGDFNQLPYVKKMGGLSNRIFTQSLAINAFGNCKNSTQLKLTPKICQKIWPETRLSLSKTMDFFKSLRISNDLVSYEVFVPVLQYYFFVSKLETIQENHVKTIEKWFWDSKFSKRYSLSALSRMKEDLSWVEKLINESL